MLLGLVLAVVVTGVSGLLPLLETRQRHLKDYKGKTIAVDASIWLYKGAYSCARELCEGSPDAEAKVADYCIKQANRLKQHNITPVLVFDGACTPMKADEVAQRLSKRHAKKAEGDVLLGNGNEPAAVACYQQGFTVTQQVAKKVFDLAAEQGIACIVSPYEADPQLAFMVRTRQADLVLTEDSDLLLYGCPKTLYKLNKHDDTCHEVVLETVPTNNNELDLSNFTYEQFIQMCIMAGCDYLKNIPGVGIKTAHKLIMQHGSYIQAVGALRHKGKRVPSDYLVSFQQVLWLVCHQRVYDPRSGMLCHLQPIPDNGLTSATSIQADMPVDPGLDFLGPIMSHEVTKGIATGALDPTTRSPYNTPLQTGPSTSIGLSNGGHSNGSNDAVPAHIMHQTAEPLVPCGVAWQGATGPAAPIPARGQMSIRQFFQSSTKKRPASD